MDNSMKQIDYRLAARGLSKSCESVLRLLPKWFGLEESLMEDLEQIENLDTYTAWYKEDLVGFFSIKHHFEQSADLYVLGIKPDFHGQGIGSHLYQLIETDLQKKGIKFVQVKTLSPKGNNAEYLLTLKFYKKMGFVPLEDFPDIWGEDNPCLQMIKHI